MTTNTTILTGSFTSTGANVNIALRSGVTWMNVYNWTQINGAQTTALAVQYYWQVGMPSGSGIKYLKSSAANAANLVESITAPNGFTFYDSSLTSYGVIETTTTAISTATIPVVTNTGTNGLIANQVVRILNQAGSPQFGGMDFTVGNLTLSATTFSLDYAPTLSVAGTTGSWMLVNSSPLYYPSSRYITNISDNSNGTSVVELSVTHNYQVGQLVRLNLPAAYGSISALNGTLVTITAAVNNTSEGLNYININIPTAAYTFEFPLAAAIPFTFAQVIPVGENTAYAEANNLPILSDATVNTGIVGITLAGGAGNPGGASEDLLYWQAGIGFNNNGL